MVLSIKNPSNFTLIRGYSPVGDMIVIFLCLLMFFLLRETFIRRSRTLHLFQLSIALLCISAFANTAFYYTVLHLDSDGLLIFFRAIHHLSLLLLFTIYINYIRYLIAVPKRISRFILALSCGICGISGIADALCPLFGFSYYRDRATGIWQDHVVLKPFSIGYLLCIAVVFFLVFYYRKRIPTQLYHMLLLTFTFSMFLVLAGNNHGHNPFLTLSFLMPILVVLYMLHANAYSVKTGALNASSLDEFLAEFQGRKYDNYYMCLKFETDAEFVMSDEMGKLFYNFWHGYFKRAMFFHPTTKLFVLAVRSQDPVETEKQATRLYQELFLQNYDNHRIPYKIVFFDHLEFCHNLEQFYEVFNFFTQEMPINTCQICSKEDYTRFHRIKYITEQLKDLSEHGTLDDPRVLVYCQPVRNVTSGCYDTAEALMRLRLDHLGMIFPDEFIPLAEKNDFIHKLSMIILNKTCREIHRLKEEGYALSRISVNMSIRELSDDHFMYDFCEVVEQNEIDYSSIAVELTESRNDTEYELLLDRVNQFKKLGIRTYLDDFGTGYSNFDRILSLKLDVVKFDRSLLLMADKDENTRFVLDYFSTAFEKLGYKVLYEGVETGEQEDICVHSHADYLQGYKFSKPIPIEQLREFLVHP